MKVRSNYVSNSSSASFVVRCRDNHNKCLLSEKQMVLLKNAGFKWANALANYFSSSIKPLDAVDLVKEKGAINLYKEVSCNDYEISEWLFKEHIPFTAMIDNRCELWVYKGGDYYEVYQNYAEQYLSGCQHWDEQDSIITRGLSDSFKENILKSKPYRKMKIQGELEDNTIYNKVQLMVEHEQVVTNLIKDKFTKAEWKKIVDAINSIKGNTLFRELQKEKKK